MKHAAGKDRKLQKELFEKQNAINAEMYAAQGIDIGGGFRGSNQSARRASGVANRNALDLLRTGTNLARDTRTANLGRLDEARDQGVSRLNNDRRGMLGSTSLAGIAMPTSPLLEIRATPVWLGSIRTSTPGPTRWVPTPTILASEISRRAILDCLSAPARSSS
jgi:hypothetical protein